MSIKTILFDLDGTLLDTNSMIIESFQHTYRTHLNKEFPREYIVETFGEILRVTLERECSHCVEEAMDTYRSFQKENFERLIEIHLGVKEALEHFYREGYKMGVVTSRLNESAIRGLRHFGLEKYFSVIIGADDTPHHKPDPMPAFMALEKLKSKADETLLVGDSPYDIQCAKNAGMGSVLVGWSILPRHLNMEHGPDYVVESMEDLVKLVENLNK